MSNNIYRAMLNDERRYPDPFIFRPERFIDESGNLNDDDKILAFGFGRRYILQLCCSYASLTES